MDIASAATPTKVAAAGTVTARAPQRSKADLFVRRLLLVKERPSRPSTRSAETAFQRSMLISATRCTLTYLVFPFVLPAFGIATSVGPALGLTIGSLALVCDVFAIRRFFAADHRWRWHFTIVAVCVMALLSVLLVEDLIDLIS
jgi:hypothetical protein